MDIKEQAHKYLTDKGCLSVGQTYTAFQVERMLTEFAQAQVKLFCQPADAKPVLQAVAVELKEPNHLDYKVQNKYGEWVWKSPYAMNRYADEWEAWYNQERQKFKEKHGLSDEELNYRGEQVLGTEGRSHCL